jgi:mannose-6-phosphate isomerase-like protein (cupin superfamily)
VHPSRQYAIVLLSLLGGTFFASPMHADHRKTDPTYLYRDALTAAEKPSDITTPTCHYKPLFGQGDPDTSVVVGVARFGEAVIDPQGACASVQYPQEDQVYVVLQGHGSAKYADETVSLKSADYLYIPSAVPHALTNTSKTPLTVVIMGFHTKGFEKSPPPPHALKANIEDVPTTLVSGHPDSARYRLLMGDAESKRDRIAAGQVLTSLYLMEIAPGGTNYPHHHQREEEIYLVLSGHGDMVAGGGMDGIEGRHPAKAGDAYFFRLNATVGYYGASDVTSRLLCVRSWYPGMQQKGAQH